MKNTIDLPEYLQRVIIERKELLVKIDSLTEFLSKNKPDHIDKKQWRLLHDQHRHMGAYYKVLCERIADAIENI